MESKKQQLKLEFNSVYHIYNCGINGCSIFMFDDDYDQFLYRLDKYINPIADIYAWALLGNHFHLLIKIKKEEEISTLKELHLLENKMKELSETKKPDINKQFAHLFNSYSNYYNNKHARHGALFERAFKRKKIENKEYFKRCLIYIHQNPIKHGFVNDIREYQHTSFSSIFSDEAGNIKKSTVLKVFENIENYITSHQNRVELIN